MSAYEAAALEAVAKAREAYELARLSENPYASAVVTQRLAEGDLVLLSTARAARTEFERGKGTFLER